MMLLKLLERIDTDRFRVCVISLTDAGEIGERIRALGFEVQALGMRPGLAIAWKFLRLIRRMRSFAPDVVHTWMYHADLIGGLAARVAGIHNVGWCVRHSNLDSETNKKATLRIARACSHLSRWVPKRILTCSQAAWDSHVAIGYDADRLLLIPNGFDVSRFRPDEFARDEVRSELMLPRGTPLVGLVARDDPQKNIEGFVEAAGRLAKRLTNVRFVLVGRRLERSNEHLKRAIDRSGCAERFVLLGQRDDIPRLMAAFDILASSSDGEAFSNVLGEAMSCGVPCVVTDAGDSADIVGKTGRVVRVGDMDALSDGMAELLAMEHRERRDLGHRARERVLERYEIGSVVKQYEAFYSSLIEATGASGSTTERASI